MTDRTNTKQKIAVPVRLKYFAYLRKSTEGEERQALSISTQEDKVREFFSNLDIEFLHEEKSAFQPNNRPIFDDIMRRIKAGERHGIIAWHPDRLSRNEIDAATITYMIRTGELMDLKFCSYNFDNSPEGIWMLQMALSQSQYDSAKKGRDVKRGLEKKISMGCPSGVAPGGYLNNKLKDKGEKDWIKDPERFDLIRKMWDMMLSGQHTPPKILEIANNDWGYRTVQRRKLGNVPLSNSTIYKMFSSIRYAGYFYQGDDDVLHKGSYEPMITLDEFDRAQAILGRHGRPRPKTRSFAYTGIPICGECGAAITAEVKTKNIKLFGLPKDFTYYHCTHRKKYIDCSQKGGITVAELEKQVDEKLAKLTILPEFAEWAVECLDSGLEKERVSNQAVVEAKRKELTRTKDDMDSLNRAMYRQQVGEEFYKKEKTELEQKVTRLEEELGIGDSSVMEEVQKTKEKFEFAVHARHRFNGDDLNERRSIMHNLGSNWRLKDKILTVEPDPVYAMIENSYKPLEDEYLRLEPARIGQLTGSNEGVDEAKSAIRLRWLWGWDSNPRPIDYT